MTKEVYYAISYTCCGGYGADYFNGFRKHTTLSHLLYFPNFQRRVNKCVSI